MIENLRANHFVLPVTTSYNHLDIPFAYPPLAMYIAALVATVLRIDSLEVVRLMPPVVATATTLAFYPLARRLTGEVWLGVFAVAAFAVLPRSYIWMVMGGGLTRSVGFFFAILALTQLYDLYDRGGFRPLALSALFSAGAVLSHMEGGWLVIYSSIAFWGNGRRGLSGLLDTVLLGVLGAILTAPWWGTILLRHGLDPFLAALNSGEKFSSGVAILSRFAFSDTPGFDILAVFGLAGAFSAIRRRHLLLPSWLFLIFVMDPRAGSTYAMLPLACLASIGFFDLARGVTDHVIAPADPEEDDVGAPRVVQWIREVREALPPLSAAVAVAILWLAAGIAAPVARREPLLILSPADREAMAWVRAATPADSRFFVLSPASGWWSDMQGEWFPALTERQSVTTVQGHEWLRDQKFETVIQRQLDAAWCGWFDSVCMLGWAQRNDRPFDFVYVPIGGPSAYAEENPRTPVPDCCTSSFDSLLHSDGFRLRYRNARVAIFEWVGERPGSRLAF
ncbi:MAG: glycosyltransferase family 39 protein [Dehalococcoidia bacterium]